MRRPRVGALFAAKRPIGELPAVAREVEALGFDELWLAEDCFLHSGPSAAATALAVTDRITVGIGLLPVSVRNPAIAAMELATLANLHPGRLQVAFGHGVEAWMRQIGARPPNRIAAMTAVVAATRALLHGEEVTHHDRFVDLDAVRLEEPPRHPPPLLIGTTGERGMAAARTVADGLLLPEGAGDAAVGWAAGQVGDAARLVVYAWMRIDDDGAAARAALAPAIQVWRDGGMYPNLVARAGLDAPVAIDDEAVGRVAVSGTAAECADAVRRLGDAGADAVVVVPFGDDPSAQLERFAQTIPA
jgi:5,10-methylenetetrahydromethanopterin reductase